MNLADLFLDQLAKDDMASDMVKMLGKKLAEQYKQNLETCAEVAKMSCENFYKAERLQQDCDRFAKANNPS